MNKLIIAIFMSMHILALQAMQQGQQLDPTLAHTFNLHVNVDRQYTLDRMADLHLAVDQLDNDEVDRVIDLLKRDKASGQTVLRIVLDGRFGGETPLTRAIKKAKNGTSQQLTRAQMIIESVMQAGADKDIPDNQGNTPTQLAAGSTVLLEALSSSFFKQLLLAHRQGDATASNKVVLLFAPLLHSSINRSDSSRVRKLLGTISREQNTEQILKNLVNVKIQGDTPLHTAVKRAGRVNEQQFEAIKDIIQMLLGAGADPSIADNQGNSPMMLLVRAPGAFEIELIKLFVRTSGRALFDAIARADTATVENVLGSMQKRGNAAQTLNTMTNDAGQTPLVYALSLAHATNNPARKQQLLYSAQYLVNAGATLEPQTRKQFHDVIKFLTGLG